MSPEEDTTTPVSEDIVESQPEIESPSSGEVSPSMITSVSVKIRKFFSSDQPEADLKPIKRKKISDDVAKNELESGEKSSEHELGDALETPSIGMVLPNEVEPLKGEIKFESPDIPDLPDTSIEASLPDVEDSPSIKLGGALDIPADDVVTPDLGNSVEADPNNETVTVAELPDFKTYSDIRNQSPDFKLGTSLDMCPEENLTKPDSENLDDSQPEIESSSSGEESPGLIRSFSIKLNRFFKGDPANQNANKDLDPTEQEGIPDDVAKTELDSSDQSPEHKLGGALETPGIGMVLPAEAEPIKEDVELETPGIPDHSDKSIETSLPDVKDSPSLKLGEALDAPAGDIATPDLDIPVAMEPNNVVDVELPDIKPSSDINIDSPDFKLGGSLDMSPEESLTKPDSENLDESQPEIESLSSGEESPGLIRSFSIKLNRFFKGDPADKNANKELDPTEQKKIPDDVAKTELDSSDQSPEHKLGGALETPGIGMVLPAEVEPIKGEVELETSDIQDLPDKSIETSLPDEEDSPSLKLGGVLEMSADDIVTPTLENPIEAEPNNLAVGNAELPDINTDFDGECSPDFKRGASLDMFPQEDTITPVSENIVESQPKIDLPSFGGDSLSTLPALNASTKSGPKKVSDDVGKPGLESNTETPKFKVGDPLVFGGPDSSKPDTVGPTVDLDTPDIGLNTGLDFDTQSPSLTSDMPLDGNSNDGNKLDTDDLVGAYLDMDLTAGPQLQGRKSPLKLDDDMYFSLPEEDVVAAPVIDVPEESMPVMQTEDSELPDKISTAPQLESGLPSFGYDGCMDIPQTDMIVPVTESAVHAQPDMKLYEQDLPDKGVQKYLENDMNSPDLNLGASLELPQGEETVQPVIQNPVESQPELDSSSGDQSPNLLGCCKFPKLFTGYPSIEDGNVKQSNSDNDDEEFFQPELELEDLSPKFKLGPSMDLPGVEQVTPGVDQTKEADIEMGLPVFSGDMKKPDLASNEKSPDCKIGAALETPVKDQNNPDVDVPAEQSPIGSLEMPESVVPSMEPEKSLPVYKLGSASNEPETSSGEQTPKDKKGFNFGLNMPKFPSLSGSIKEIDDPVDTELPENKNNEPDMSSGEQTPKDKKGFKFGLTMPKFPGLSGSTKEIDDPIDTELPENKNNEPEMSSGEQTPKDKKGFNFGLNMPKFPGLSGSTKEIDDPRDTELPENKNNDPETSSGEQTPKDKKGFNFGLTMPKFPGLSDSTKEIDDPIDTELPENKNDDPETSSGEQTPKDKKGFKLGLNMPKFPGLSGSTKETDDPIDTELPENKNDDPEMSSGEQTPKDKKGFNFGLNMPKFPGLSGSTKEIDDPIDTELPENKNNDPEMSSGEQTPKDKKGFKFGLNMPKFPGLSGSTKETDDPIDTELPENKNNDPEMSSGEQTPKDKKGFKFGLNMPKFPGLSGSTKEIDDPIDTELPENKNDDPETSSGEQTPKDKKGFKPGLTMPKFPGLSDSTKEIDDPVDTELPENKNNDPEMSSGEQTPKDKRGFKFGLTMPKFPGMSDSSKPTDDSVDTELPVGSVGLKSGEQSPKIGTPFELAKECPNKPDDLDVQINALEDLKLPDNTINPNWESGINSPEFKLGSSVDQSKPDDPSKLELSSGKISPDFKLGSSVDINEEDQFKPVIEEENLIQPVIEEPVEAQLERSVEMSPEQFLPPGKAPKPGSKSKPPTGLKEDAIKPVNEKPIEAQQAKRPTQQTQLPAFNANACRAYGRGIQPTGLRMREKADFHVTTKDAGDADLKVTVKGPRGSNEPVTVKKNPKEPEVFDCEYYPLKQGNYTVDVTFGGKPIPKSPFEILVGPEAGAQKVRAYGPGLHGGKVGHSADFVVETIGTEVGQLGFSIEGPSQAKIECEDCGDGSCDVKYHPTEPGEYAVHVVCDDNDIKGSPFMAQIAPADTKSRPDMVKAYGPGLESGTPVNGRPTNFTVDAKRAGAPAPVEVVAVAADGENLPVKVKDNGDGTYDCDYTPKNPIKHTIIPSYDGVAVKDSPFRVNVNEDSYPDKVKVYGPGVEPGLKAEEPTYFTVDCARAGNGDVSIGIKCAAGVVGPTERDVEFEIIKNDASDTFTVKYTPPGPGEHTIMVLFAEQPVPKSPITVNVASSHNAKKVKADGPGIEKEGVECGKPTHFTIYTKGAGKAKPNVQFKPARGSYKPPASKADILDNKDNTYTVSYTPHAEGPMDVEVTYGGDKIPNSPFPVDVAPALDVNAVKVKGLEDKMDVGKPQEFEVLTKGAGGQGKLDVDVVGPSNLPIHVHDKKTPNGKKCHFTPVEEGPHRVNVAYDGIPVRGSPFLVDALTPADPSKVRAYGPGLSGGVVNQSAPFTIETADAGNGGLGLTVEGPCEAKIECIDNGDGSCSVAYMPTEAGDYKINVLFADKHIPGSPFNAKIEPAFDASKVDLSGPGLESGKIGKPSKICADCCSAGDAPLTADVLNDDGTKVPTKVKDNGDGTHDITFVPNKPGKALVNVQYGGISVPKSPVSVPIKPDVDTSGVRTTGPGVQPDGVLADVEAEFQVDAGCLAPRGGKHVTAKAVGPSGTAVPVDLKDNRDGTYDAKYSPYEKGPHQVIVDYDDVPVPGSPFNVGVDEGCDPTKVKAYGPGLEQGTTAKPAKFMVDTRGAGTGGLGLVVEGPSDAKITCTDSKDGTCAVEYLPTAPGEYEVNITYGGENIPGSPFIVPVKDTVDPTKVSCNGPGVSPGVRANVPQEFTVDCSTAGVAPLDVAVKGPKGLKEPVDVRDNGDGTHTVKYTPTKEGPYQVQVKYADHEIPRSPYRVRVQPTHDASKVKCNGPGIASGGVPASLPVEFTIDATDAGDGVLAVQITNPKREKYSVEMPPAPKKPTGSEGVGPGARSPKRKSPSKSHSPTKTRPGRGSRGSEDSPGRKSRSRSGSSSSSSSSSRSRSRSSSSSSSSSESDSPKASSPTKGSPRKSASGTGEPYERSPRKRGGVKSGAKDSPCREVHASDPEGRPKRASVRDNGDGTYSVSYIPDTVGRYTISVKYGGDEIPYSPYRIRAVPSGDANKCLVSVCFGTAGDGLGPNIYIGEEAVITVDPNGAGPGNVTCAVTTPDGEKLDADVVQNKDGTFDIFYTPKEVGPYTINIHFGGEEVPNSPYRVTAVPGLKPAPVVEEDFQQTAVAPAYSYMNGSEPAIEQVDGPDSLRPVQLVFEVPSRPGNLTSEVTTPSGIKESPVIKNNGDGTITVQYQPHEPGLHEMAILLDNEHISGSPIQFYADVMAPGHVTAYGPGLVTGKVDEPANFTIVTKDAGAGGLALAVEGPSKADITCQDNKDGTCSVTYLPTAPGEYTVTVKFDDQHIPGSPYTANISGGADQRKSKLSYGTTSDVALKINESDLSLLSASIEAPSGHKESCVLKKLPNGHIGISFTPKEIGEHLVSVKKRGRHIANSPFRIMVGESEIGDASKVKVYGDGKESACAGETAVFMVDTRQAGYGGLGLSIEGPSKVDINCEDMDDGVCRVTYTPQEPGNYVINVKFADKHVPGSPFTVVCTGDDSPQKKGSILRQQKAASVATVGSTCDLNLKIPNNWMDLMSSGAKSTRHASSFSQSYSRVEQSSFRSTGVSSQSQSMVRESFSPSSQSSHSLLTSSASPFVPKFTSSQGKFGTFEHSLKATGAGLADLSAEVKSPCGDIQKAEIVETDENTYSIRFIPKEMGVHTVSVRYMGQHVPGSPFEFTVGPLGEGGAHKVTAGGPGLEGAVVSVPADFSIWTREAGAGGLSIAVEGPSKADINFEDRKDGSCGVSYVVTEPGDYEVNVKFNDQDIPGSPFPVTVTGVGKNTKDPQRFKSDASKVRSYGSGLRRAVIGENTFSVDCCNAGSNMLLVGVHGPLTPCEEVHVKHVGQRKYAITYTAKEAGDYLLIVKWGDDHIPGSPFHVKIP
uniref:filamin-B isoform X9 n=1 Tax=Ciona intestinalis TaxID=7719 RepID=UPI000EF4D288|nr:filamin-B isoform X9 [Ciona intestinalis]|eukprot:XP_026692720.1 filamin-B isoform X9 [Ciona intestinalis]